MLTSTVLLLLAGLAAPQSLPPDPGVQEATERTEANAEREQRKKRILQLRGGHSLRALTQYVDGAWQFRRDGKWVTLNESSVLKWRSEAEALKESRSRGRALKAKDLAGRSEYATWLVQEGLMEEATGELDAILHLDPDAEKALALLSSPRFPRLRAGNGEIEPGEIVERLSRAGLSAGPVDRELLIRSLGSLKETEAGSIALRNGLRSGLHSPNILNRTFSAHALRRLLPGEELYRLMQRCILDVSSPVRTEAALAVRAAGDPGLVLPLVKALTSDSRAVRTNAAESLGVIGFNSAVPALVSHLSNLSAAGSGGVSIGTRSHIVIGSQFAYVQDFDLEIAQGSSIADPIVRTTQDVVMLDARVSGVYGYTFVTEYRKVAGALKRITGANPGSSVKDWKQWYDEHQERFATR